MDALTSPILFVIGLVVAVLVARCVRVNPNGARRPDTGVHPNSPYYDRRWQHLR